MASLSQRTKDFFVERITKKLHDEIASLKQGINTETVEKVARQMVAEDLGIASDLAKYEALQKEQSELNRKINKLANSMEEAFCAAGYYNFRTYDVIRSVDTVARDYVSKAVSQIDPQKGVEIERLTKAIEDVEGVILLATTTPQLREALVKISNAYGVTLEGMDFLD